MRKSLLFSLATLFFISSVVMLVNAKSYDYKATSNYHGVDVPFGATVIVTATTNDPSVTRVTFIWKNANEDPIFTEPVVISGGTAQSSQRPNSLGEWGVQTFFQGSGGTTKGGNELTIKIRATSFNVIPEIPLLGTAGASIAMILGFTYKVKRKPQK